MIVKFVTYFLNIYVTTSWATRESKGSQGLNQCQKKKSSNKRNKIHVPRKEIKTLSTCVLNLVEGNLKNLTKILSHIQSNNEINLNLEVNYRQQTYQ